MKCGYVKRPFTTMPSRPDTAMGAPQFRRHVRARRRVLLLAAGCAVGASLYLGTATPAWASGTTVSSYNWAGYADLASTGQTFSYVSGSWTVPTVIANPTSSSSYSSFWVGLDGVNSQSVEQDGVEADYSGGTATYYAWYEMYPAVSIPISTSTLTVHPGNVMTGSVIYLGNNEYQLQLKNLTTGQNFSITQQSTVTEARSSAEWIAEAPTVGGGGSYAIAPLADFGSVTFTNALATLDGITGPISDFPYYQINLSSIATGLSATTSDLNGAGNSFTVTTGSTTPTTPSSLTWDPNQVPGAPTNAGKTWDTTSTLWSNITSNPTTPSDSAWSNSAGDIAIFGTTNGPTYSQPHVFNVALGANISVADIVFNPTADGSTYDITPGSGNYSLSVSGDIVMNTSGKISAVLSGLAASINVVGPATLTLSGANTYEGGTTVSSGTLNLTGSLYNGGSLTVNGGTFELNNPLGQIIGALNGSTGAIEMNSGSLTVEGGGFFAGTISGVGGVIVNGQNSIAPAALVLEPLLNGNGTPTANTYEGGTTVENGATLVVDTSPTVAILSNPSSSETPPPLSTDVLGSGDLQVTNGATLETINGLLAHVSGVSAIGTGVAINVGSSTSDYVASYEQDNSNLVLTISGSPASQNFDSIDLVNNGTATFGLTAPPQQNTLTLYIATNAATDRPVISDFDLYTLVKTTGNIIVPYVVATGKAYPFSAPSTGTVQTMFSQTAGAGIVTKASTPVLLPTGTDPNYNAEQINFYESVVPGTGVVITAQTLFNVAAFDLTSNQSAVANYLDTYATPLTVTSGSSLANALAALSQLPANEIGPALDQLTPQTSVQALSNIAVQNGIFESQQVFGQIANVFNGVNGFNAAGLTMLNTPNADPFTAALNSAMQSNAQAAHAGDATDYLDAWNDNSGGENGWNNTAPVDNSWENSPAPVATPSPIAAPTSANALSGFLSGQVIFGNLAGVDNANPHFTTGNAIAGINYNMASHLAVGAFFSYGYTDSDLGGGGSLIDHSYSPGAYVGLHKGGAYIDAMGSFTYNDYTQHRNVLGGTASSSPTGNQFDLNAMTGYDFGPTHQPGFKWGPAVGIGYTYLNVGSYSETGSPAPLSVSAQTINSVRSLMGLRVSDTWLSSSSQLPWGWNLNAFWQHEFDNNSQSVTASFTGLGGAFTVNTVQPGRDSALLGGGVNGYLTQNLSLFVNYEAQVGDRSQMAQSVMAGLAIAIR